MRRIDLSYFYDFGRLVYPLVNLSGEQIWDDVWFLIYKAHERINDMLERGFFTSSRVSADNLLDALKPFIPDFEKDNLLESIDKFRIGKIARCAREFEICYMAELAIEPSYIVTPKGGYDVQVLALDPQMAFPHDLTRLVEKTKYDVEQAGKCLAFEVPTAAAFHLHRINEAVLHKYFEACTRGENLSPTSNIGHYLTSMTSDAHKADFEENVVAVLKQINTLHRNPVLHPENDLTSEEAIELFGIIVSAVSTMLKFIRPYQDQEKKQPLTSPLALENQSS